MNVLQIDVDPVRRRVLAGLAGLLAPAPAWSQALPEALPQALQQAAHAGEVRTIDGIAFMRAVIPPGLIQQALRVQQAATLTQPVMEQSQARPVREFREYLDRKVAREPDRMRRLEMVNLYVNDRVREVPDDKVYVSSDIWAPPINTLLIGGDCEDLALLKRWGLARVGFDRKDMYLVCGVTWAVVTPSFHAVLGVVFPPSRGIILDTLSSRLHASKEGAKFEPTYALNEDGFWRVESPNLAYRAYWDPITKAIQPG